MEDIVVKIKHSRQPKKKRQKTLRSDNDRARKQVKLHLLLLTKMILIQKQVRLKVKLPFLGAMTILDKSAVDENEIETQTTDAGAADTETAAE